jgi:D-specific alpha-keto acid dehydrogenase
VAYNAPAQVAALGITIYGCEQDEADKFYELCPRFWIVPTILSAGVSEASVISVPRNRCISVGHKSDISGRVLRVLKEAGVEYISTRSIGFDHIDLHAADNLGITVENVVYAPDGVADYTLMLILMAIRNAKAIVSAAEKNDFRLSSARGKDLRDMTVGVLGAGHIGNAVIRRLHGFGCRVLAYSNGRTAAAVADFVSLEKLLIESDIVTLHLPLNADTHHVIGRKQLAMMKHGAFLINTGRGALVDTEALIVALEGGRLGGAALDVLEGEDGLFYADCTARSIDNQFLLRLQRLPNAIVTPHTAYYTERALHDTVERTLANCLSFERNRTNDKTQDRDLVRGLLGRT